MNKATIRHALDALAQSGTQEELNLWPAVEVSLRNEQALKTRKRATLPRAVTLAAAGVVLISSVAYAFYRLSGGDVGLLGVQQAGLITPIGVVALPTVYTTPPSVAIPEVVGADPMAPIAVIAEQVLGDVKVSLDWAYADESRVALQFTVTGLKPPDGLQASAMIGPPILTDENGTPLGGSGGGGGGGPAGGSAQNGVTNTYVIYTQTDADAHPQLNLTADLPIGGMEATIFPPEANAEPQVVYLPPVGSFHFEFSVPVYKGLELAVGEVRQAGGVTMRLETVEVNRSHTEAQVCFSMPSPVDWIPVASMRVGTGAEVTNSGLREAEGTSFQLTAPERCALLGFDVLFDGDPTTLILTVPKLVASGSTIQSPDRIQAARGQLSSQGIDFDYLVEEYPSGGRGVSLTITRKPDDMSEQQAYDLVNAALEDHILGPWTFTVEVPAAPSP